MSGIKSVLYGSFFLVVMGTFSLSGISGGVPFVSWEKYGEHRAMDIRGMEEIIRKDINLKENPIIGMEAFYLLKNLNAPGNVSLPPDVQTAAFLYFHLMEENTESARFFYRDLKNKNTANKFFSRNQINMMEFILYGKKIDLNKINYKECGYICLPLAGHYLEKNQSLRAQEILRNILENKDSHRGPTRRLFYVYVSLVYLHLDLVNTSKPNPEYLARLQSEFPEELALWKRVLPLPPERNFGKEYTEAVQKISNPEQLPYFGGTFRIAGENQTMDVVFEKDGDNVNSVVSLNGDWKMMYHNHIFYWRGKENVYETSRIWDYRKEEKNGYRLSFDLEDTFFNYSFTIGMDSDKFIFQLPPRVKNAKLSKQTVYYNPENNTFYLLPVSLRTMMDSLFFKIALKGNNPSQIMIFHGKNNFVINFANLQYRKADIIQKEKYIKGKTRVIPHAIPKKYLNHILVQMTSRPEKRTAPNSEENERISEAIKKYYLEEKKILGMDTSSIAAKAEFYQNLAQAHPEDKRLWFIATKLYYYSYDFLRAEESAYQYLLAMEKTSGGTLDFYMGENPEEEITKYYVQSLVQNHKIKPALDFLRDKNTFSTGNSITPEKFSLAILEAQVHIHSGNYAAGEKIYDEIIREAEKGSGEQRTRDSALYNKILLIMYLGKMDEAAKVYSQKISGGKSPHLQNLFSFLKNPAEENPVRYKNVHPRMGKGKNFCAPMAIQFALDSLEVKNIPDQKLIARELKTTENGTSFHEIVEYFQRREMVVSPHEASLDDIARHIAMGLPVLALVYNTESRMGHITPVIGVDLKRRLVYFSEPDAPSSIDFMKEEDFIRSQMYTGNISLFIYRKNDKPEIASRNHRVGNAIAGYLDYVSRENSNTEGITQYLTELEKLNNESIKKFIHYQKLRLVYAKIMNKKKITKDELDFISKLKPQITDWNNADEIQILQGKFFLLQGNPYLALESWKNALQLNPRSWEAMVLLTDIYLNAGNVESAQAMVSATLDLNPPEGILQEFHIRQIKIFLAKKQYVAAIPWALEIADFSYPNPFSKMTIDLLKNENMENTLKFLMDINFGQF